MTDQNHTPRPGYIERRAGYIGKTAFSKNAQEIRNLSSYLRSHIGQNQIFTYTGPPPRYSQFISPDYDFVDEYGGVVEFPIILHSPPKVDSTVTHRQLAGAILPWRRVPRYSYRGYVDKPVKVYWRHLYNGKTANNQLHRSDSAVPLDWDEVHPMANEYQIDPETVINLLDYRSPNMFLDGDGEGSTGDLFAFWSTGNGAALSHDTAQYYGGNKSMKVLCTGTSNPYATGPYIDGTAQLTVGASYIFSCWARGDGTASPKVLTAATEIDSGTSSATWQKLSGVFYAEETTIRFQATTSTSSTYCHFDNIDVRELGNFKYEPDGDGEFTVGFLGVERMCVAALSIWTAPDRKPTDDQVVVTQKDLMPGRAIRGYTGTGRGSIGDHEYLAGKGGAAYDVDDTERCTRRCLLQSGHPLGLSHSDDSAYYNIRGGNASYYKVFPRNLTGLSTGSNVSSIPVLYGRCQGAAVGNEAYVKYTALTSGDTWEYAIDSDTAGLWYDTNRLELDAAGDSVKIEVKAPPGGYIVINTYSLWEDGYDQ